jgi:hypothetical protein
VVSVPDWGGGASDEVGVLVEDSSGVFRVVLVDEVDGSVTAELVLPSGWVGVDLEVVPLSGGLAVLLERPSDGKVKVRVFDSGGGVVDVGYGLAFSATDLEVTPSGGLAVLGTRASDGKVRVRVVTPGVAGFEDFRFGLLYSGDDLEVLGDGLAVLGTRDTGKVRVRVVGLSGGVVNRYFGLVYSGDDLEWTPGGELVVMGTRDTGKVRLRTVDVGGFSVSDVFLGTVYSPGLDLEVGSGGDRVVLAARDDGRVLVRSVDVGGGSEVLFPQGAAASGLDVELTAGGDYVVMGVQHSDSAVRVRVNETDGSGGFHQYTIN